VFQYIFKVFTIEIVEDLLELFEMLSTIKPLFSSSGAFTQLNAIFNTLLYYGRHHQNTKGIEAFERRFRSSCSNLAAIFSELVESKDEDKDINIKYVNLLKVMSSDNQ
jgi:hypothetical protein